MQTRATREDAAAVTGQREEEEEEEGEGHPLKKESHSTGEKLTDGAGDIKDEELHSIS